MLGRLSFVLLSSLSLLVSSALYAAEPMLKASLRDAQANAKKGGATVEVQVTGLELVDPGPVRPGQGHLHYRMDHGPVIATTATKLGFHELTPGPHRLEIRLVGNDHQPLGPAQTLEVQIPPAGAAATSQPKPSSASPRPSPPNPSPRDY